MGVVDPFIQGVLENEPSFAWFGFAIEEATEGRAVVSLVVGRGHVNANDMAHGAIVFAVADQVRDELLAALVSAGVGHPGTLAEKLRSALTAFLEIIVADPHIHRIATGDVSSVPGLAEHRAGILDLITDLIVEHAPGVLGVETPNKEALRRGAIFMVGGVNQLIETWLKDPVATPAELAAVSADLCVAVVKGVGTD